MKRYLVISQDESGAWYVEDFPDYKEAEGFAESLSADGTDAHIVQKMETVRGKVLVDEDTASAQPWKTEGWTEAEWRYAG